MSNRRRDNFSAKTHLQIAKRAGWLCSFPACRAHTVGSTLDGEGEINIGIASHICAASQGGPRYDPTMTPEERASVKNGIWMCNDHGKAIDSDEKAFPVELLREWKKQAEKESWARVLRVQVMQGPAPLINLELSHRFKAAAEADLGVFKNMGKWPSTTIELKLQVDGSDEPMSTSALANAVTDLNDLILIAPPGMGKTTTIFQIAEGVLHSENGIPFVLPLGDWATSGKTILQSILERHAFSNLSEMEFRVAAEKPGLVMLLDGWNELDSNARELVRAEVSRLKGELPELGLIVSTRKQIMDVPFEGTSLNLLPLSEEQQLQIAYELRGEEGAKIIDQAWRTSGVRELVTIPLYLSTLLSLPRHSPFPETKEQVLRYFVEAHEKDYKRKDALYALTQGCHQQYLNSLAVFATRSANTSITEQNARRLVSQTSKLLREEGQISTEPSPLEVLSILVSNHVLVRAGDSPSYSFHHQQFQEWYASHWVEQRILVEVSIPEERNALMAEIFDFPMWEETILFAIERLSRGDVHQKSACSDSILAAFEVDPILAAEMIFRSTEQVWKRIEDRIQQMTSSWHSLGEVDRAFTFMMTTGRPEFFDKVWPLLTHENKQISLEALRSCKRFRPTILGQQVEEKIKSLPSPVRSVFLSEMAFNSSMDGLDLASAIAKSDSDPEVLASVVGSLSFRRANRHIAMVLQDASNETIELIVSRQIVEDTNDIRVNESLMSARKRMKHEFSAYSRLNLILHLDDDNDYSEEIVELIVNVEIDNLNDEGGLVQLIHQANIRYPQSVSQGILKRMQASKELFWGANKILASAKLILDEDYLLNLALQENHVWNSYPESAATVLGPRATGLMIDELSKVKSHLLDEDGKYIKTVSERYHHIQSLLACVPGVSLVTAIEERSLIADNEQMSDYAQLLSRHSNAENDIHFSIGADDSIRVHSLIEVWSNRMLSSGSFKRQHLANVATLASNFPHKNQLSLLQKLLDINLEEYHKIRSEAQAGGFRQTPATTEASYPLTYEYKNAFNSIKFPETRVLMERYLTNPYFGELAASVITNQWVSEYEAASEPRLFAGVDFKRVKENRYRWKSKPSATTKEAESIFAIIEPYFLEDSTSEKYKLALALSIHAVRLPHGFRESLINELAISMPLRGRAKLVTNLILSGAEVDTNLVGNSIAEMLLESKGNYWALAQGGAWELREWLQLLPFTNRLNEIVGIIQTIPDELRTNIFDDLFKWLGDTPSENAEDVLFKLAEVDIRFYLNHQWRLAVLKLGTVSASIRLIDLAMTGAMDNKTINDWHWMKELSSLITNFKQVRDHVYNILRNNNISRPLRLLARSVAESPDVEGILLLIDIETKQQASFLSWQSIQHAITESIPDSEWSGAYNIVPIDASELRQKLLAKTTDGSKSDIASKYLRMVDAVSFEYGQFDHQVRHPDLASGKPWPILKPDPFVNQH